MSVISHDSKFIFISNARTGSTSMMDMLDKATASHKRHYLGLGALPFEYHMSLEDSIKNHPEAADYFKCCFVRNPWSRFLSSFREFSNYWHAPWNEDITRFREFEDFCLSFPSLNIRNDIHFIPLTNQIYIDGNVSMDFIGRFENYKEEVYRLFSLLRLPEPNLEHYRATTGDHYRSVYTDKSRKVIEDYYADDIKNFNYSF